MMKSDPETRPSITVLAIGTAILLSFSACGKRPITSPVTTAAPECVILTGTAEKADTITVALFDEVHPGHAPVARNPSEQLLFAHLYETLFSIDCRGEVYSRLVQSWSSDDGGRRWTFELREGDRFWDGTRVTSGDIARNWERALSDSEGFPAGIDSMTVEGDRILHIYCNYACRNAPRMLASIDFAVSKRTPDFPWPLGTGPYQMDMSERWNEGVSIGKTTIGPSFGKEGPMIRFVDAFGRDRRDLLDGQVDVMITADPAVIEYAESRQDLITALLPWDRTYVLLSTSRVQELRRGGTVGELPSDLLDDWARDVVRGDARTYESHVWWEDLRACREFPADVDQVPPLPIGAYGISGQHRILYDDRDQIARGLTERIVALTTIESGVSSGVMALVSAIPGIIRGDSRAIAAGVTRGELESSLLNGDDFAYVIPIPRRTTDSCFEAGRLLNMARWLAIDGVDLSDVIVPLVDTRRHLIARQGGIGLSIDWNGSIFIATGMSRER